MTVTNTVLAPAGIYPGAGVTYVASDGSHKAATILAVASSQAGAVNHKRDGEIQPAGADRVHVRVISLSGKVYNRYDVPAVDTTASVIYEADNSYDEADDLDGDDF